jgi:hypothetical protein
MYASEMQRCGTEDSVHARDGACAKIVVILNFPMSDPQL